MYSPTQQMNPEPQMNPHARLESAPKGPDDSGHCQFSYFISLARTNESSVEAMVLCSLGRLIASPPPLLPESLPSALAPFLQELAALQAETNYCLRVVCMKVSLHLSLVFNADMRVRAAISSSMAAYLAGLEGEDCLHREALDAFLQTEFIEHSICSPPVTTYLAQSDFLDIIGHAEIFRSTLEIYISDMALCALASPGLEADEITHRVFACPGECVGEQVLPRLAAVGQGLARLVSDRLDSIRDEYEAFLLS